MKIRVQAAPRGSQRTWAFTLLEVIIACTIFFMFAFAVLQLVTSGLVAARKLQQRRPNPGIIAAEVVRFPTLVEGSGGGTFEDLMPGLYPGYSFETNILEVYSNSFFQVDILIYGERGEGAETMRMYLHRPGSPPGSATSGR